MDHLNTQMQKWAEAHVFYSTFLHKSSQRRSSIIADAEVTWREWAARETPNGKLLLKNSFFDSLKNDSKIYLFHVTPNIDKIIESGVLYSSGGCLVGSPYVTPLNKTKNGFRVHNLGQYIFQDEAPHARYLKENRKDPAIIILEVDLPARAHDNLIGIDYTKLGSIHLAIYKDLEYLLSHRERIGLQEILLNKIKQSLSYFNLIGNDHGSPKSTSIEDFFEVFLPAIDHLPILGYIFFEVIAEYLMLHESGGEADQAHANGEFYNAGYKNMMFKFFPELLKGYGLGMFKPHPDQITNYIESNKMVRNFDKKAFLEYLMNRITFLSRARLINEGEEIDWGSFSWDFKGLEPIATPLLGHLVHRELRNFGRFPDFYFYFDQFKALQVWNYWNHMGVVIPFNGIVPKGEVGINPAWPDLKVKAYIGKEVRRKEKGMFIEQEKEIDIKVVPRLVDHGITIMRSGGNKKSDDIFGTFRD